MQIYQPQRLQWIAPARQSGRVPSLRELPFWSADIDRLIGSSGALPKISLDLIKYLAKNAIKFF